MEVILGVLLGWAIAASAIAAFRLIRPPRVISNEQRAMQEALHAATATLPHLRRGLSAISAAETVGHRGGGVCGISLHPHGGPAGRQPRPPSSAWGSATNRQP